MKQSSVPGDHPSEVADYTEEVTKPVNSLFSDQDPIDETALNSNRVSKLRSDIALFVHFDERYDLTNRADVAALVAHLRKHKDTATMRRLNVALQNLANSRERERRLGLAKRSLFPRAKPTDQSESSSPRKPEGLSHLPDPSIHFPRSTEKREGNSLNKSLRVTTNRNFFKRMSQVTQPSTHESFLKRSLATQGGARRKRGPLYDSMPSIPNTSQKANRGMQFSMAVSPKTGNRIECQNPEFSQTDAFPSRKETRRGNRKHSKGEAQSQVGSMTTTNTRTLQAQKMEQSRNKKMTTTGYSKQRQAVKTFQPTMTVSPRDKPKTSNKLKKKRQVKPIGSMPQIGHNIHGPGGFGAAFSPAAWEQTDENIEFREQDVQILEKDYSMQPNEPFVHEQQPVPFNINLPQMPGRLQSMPTMKEDRQSIFEPRADPFFDQGAVSSSGGPIPTYPSGYLKSMNDQPEQTLNRTGDTNYFSKELLNNQVLSSTNLNQEKQRSLKKLQKRRALPLIDFTKLNKLRLKKQFIPNRDLAMSHGGVPLWQRTKRQTIQASMPESMFMGTHILHSQQTDHLQTLQAESVLKEQLSSMADSSFHENYDDVVRDPVKLQGISQAQQTIDYTQRHCQRKHKHRYVGSLNSNQKAPTISSRRSHARHGSLPSYSIPFSSKRGASSDEEAMMMDGTSTGPVITRNSIESLDQQRVGNPMPSVTDSLNFSSIQVPDQSTSYRKKRPAVVDHQLMNKNMNRYFRKTFRPKLQKGSVRDSSIDQASREAERQNMKYIRMQQQLSAIVSYRSSVTKKKEYIENLLENYPFLANYLDPLMDIYNLSLDQIMYKANTVLHSHQLEQAAVRLQRFWRRRSVMMVSINLIRKQIRAAKVIQKAWRQSRWIRLLNQLIKIKRNTAAILIQKFLRGFYSRQQTIELLKGKHLGTNFEFFEAMRLRLLTDACILIQYHFKRFKKKKEIERKLKLQAQRVQAQERRKKKGLMPLKKHGSTTSKNSQGSATRIDKVGDSFSSFNNTIQEGDKESSHSSTKGDISRRFLNINQPIVVAELNSSQGSRNNSRRGSQVGSRRGSHHESSKSNHRRSNLRGQKTMIDRQGSFFQRNGSSNQTSNHGGSGVEGHTTQGYHYNHSSQRVSHLGTPHNLDNQKQASHGKKKSNRSEVSSVLHESKSRQHLEKNNQTVMSSASERKPVGGSSRGSPGKKPTRKGTRALSKEGKIYGTFG